MKKIRNIGIIVFFTVITVLLFQSDVKATFYIQNFDVKAEVLENGDMKVEENITYSSTETKNGVTRELVAKNNSNSKNSADSITLEEVLVDGQKAQKVNSGKLGQDKVYEYSHSKKKASLKVYMPFNSARNRRIVTYRYRLSNVAVKYKDTAEIFWNFIGKEWDTSIQKVHIQITLPEQAANNTIYVYGHGSDNGRFTKQENVIDLYASGLKANQALDARILFDRASVPESLKVVNKSVLDKYRKQEEGISANKNVTGAISVKEISIFFSIIIIVAGIIIYLKYDKEEKVLRYDYYREIPYDLAPEILQTIYYQKVQNNSFFVAFLNLVKKGVYTITKTTNEVGIETELITYQKGEKVVLEDYEKEVKKTINGFMDGREKSINLLSLEEKMKNSEGSGGLNFKKKLEGKIKELFGDKTKTSNKLGKALGIAMLVFIIMVLIIGLKTGEEMAFVSAVMLGLTGFIYTMIFKSIDMNIFTVVFLLIHFTGFQIGNISTLIQAKMGWLYLPYILLFILIQYVFRVKKSTKEERQIREQIKGLRRYIKEYSYLDEREETNEVQLWQDYFILAVALKLNKRVVDYFYNYCKELGDNMGNSLSEVGSYYMMSTALASSFNTYTRTSSSSYSSGSSSYSGSSGGFSGGSSSGGGGRRWRRGKLLLRK